MPHETVHLPTDADALRAIIAQKEAEIARLSSHLQLLQEQLNLLTAKRFGRRSEKYHSDQFRLFNEAEVEAVAIPEEDRAETIEIAAHRRARGGRKPLPTQLPRIEVVHDLSDEEKICPHDGSVLKAIGEEIAEQLDIEPANVRVIRHVRKKYACPHCQQGVKTAPLPPQPICRQIPRRITVISPRDDPKAHRHGGLACHPGLLDGPTRALGAAGDQSPARSPARL